MRYNLQRGLSQMLHRMRQLLDDSAQDFESPLLHKLFVDCLPQNPIPVLATAGEASLEKLVELADRIADYSCAGSTVSLASVITPDTDTSRLEGKVNQLAASIAAMRISAHP
ncbi:hypothetical protein HPB52_021607 [Rhipicephalus sanguineus]|uniref:Uncharacterized protein n=1 Tax=Rhipicephalus sanguineus TaxID=34632 RepID=A0A9D4T6B2_RHISA|nr:hypothetical protein HPB52_021607 [Rhipicephalus sanguineus]